MTYHAPMLCVHLIPFLTLSAGLGSWARAVASTGLVARRAQQLAGILEAFIETTGALVTLLPTILLTTATLSISLPGPTTLITKVCTNCEYK